VARPPAPAARPAPAPRVQTARPRLPRPLLVGLALLLALGAALALLARGGTGGGDGATAVRLEDSAWQGGYGYADGRTYGGRNATWIYGATTEYSAMRAEFELDEAPACEAALVVEGMDSEGPAKTAISVAVNGAEIYRGPNPLPDDDLPLESGTWATHAFSFDGGLLRAGRNEVRIANLEAGQFGRPPFFMLDYADIGCAP
jgi:hypothetical protein